MISGDEWVMLLLLLGVVGVALGVWLAVRATRDTGAGAVSEARVYGSADEVLRDLQLATAGVPGTVTRRETPDSITAEWSFTPGWAFFVAIIAFPIGLVALLARRSVVGTVVVNRESPAVARLRIAGSFHRRAAQAINSVIEARAHEAVAPAVQR